MTRSITTVAVGVHLTGVAVLVVIGAVSGLALDPLRPVPIAVIYGAPALLAILGLRGRTPLLLVAAVAGLVLAVLPFSVHSFLLAPASLVYLLAALRMTGSERHSRLRVFAAIAGGPLLLFCALLVLLGRDHPACYAGATSSGCTSDTVVWWEALGSIGLAVAAVVAAWRLVGAAQPARHGRNPAGPSAMW